MGRPGACWGSRLPTEASLSPPGPQCCDLSASSLLLRGPCLFCDILMVSGRLTRLSGGSGMGTGAAPALARQDPGPRAPGSQTALCSPYEWAVAGAEPCHSVWRGPHLTLPTAVPQSWLSPRGNSPPPPSARPETACAVLCRDPCPLSLQKGVQAGPPGGQAGQVRGANAKTLRQAPGPRHHFRAHTK